MTTLKVSEIFGPCWQGEGSTTGQLCCFLRLSGCNLKCGWCDTKYASEGEFVEIREVIDHLYSLLPRRVIITGGEPLLQQQNLQPVIDAMHESRVIIEIETNGTIIPTLHNVSRYNVSPKLRNAGPNWLNMSVLTYFSMHTSAIFKFVCSKESDVREVGGIGLPNSRVWIMPKGVTTAELDESLAAIIPLTREYGYNLSDRLHIRLFGNKRGV